VNNGLSECAWFFVHKETKSGIQIQIMLCKGEYAIEQHFSFLKFSLFLSKWYWGYFPCTYYIDFDVVFSEMWGVFN